MERTIYHIPIMTVTGFGASAPTVGGAEIPLDTPLRRLTS
jgi:hypothetical protein